MKQFDAQIALQATDELTDGGWRHIEFGRRRGITKVPGYRLEGTQRVEVVRCAHGR